MTGATARFGVDGVPSGEWFCLWLAPRRDSDALWGATWWCPHEVSRSRVLPPAGHRTAGVYHEVSAA